MACLLTLNVEQVSLTYCLVVPKSTARMSPVQGKQALRYFPILYFLILILRVRRRIIIQLGSISREQSVFIGQSLLC